MAETCKECENSKYKEGALFCGSYNTYPSNIDVAAKDCSHFTPKKPPSETYAERQEAWVKKHGIKVGSKIKILRKAENCEVGWSVCWVPPMDNTVGTTGTIINISIYAIQVGSWNYPYFVLKPVKADGIIVAAIYAFNKATAWLFGEKK